MILLATEQLSLELSHSTITYYFMNNFDVSFIIETYKNFLEKKFITRK